MRLRSIALLLCLLIRATPLHAQGVVYNGGVSQSAVDAVRGQIPPICSTPPAMDTTNGSVGTGQACTPPMDSTRPTSVQIATATGGGLILTAADGSFSGVWPRTWNPAPSYAHAEIYGSALPYLCVVSSATTTAVSGKCWQAVTTALPGTLLALSQTVVNPFASASSGLTVRVVGRQ